jgi:hypothetical protein
MKSAESLDRKYLPGSQPLGGSPKRISGNGTPAAIDQQ